MTQLTATVERLRAVRQARQHFLTLWVLDDVLTRHPRVNQAFDQIADDLFPEITDGVPGELLALQQADNDDWSILHRRADLVD